MADCVVCGRPQPDMAYACATCAHHLGRRLRDAADLVPELTTALARQTRWAEPGPRPRNSAPAESIRLGLLADPGDDHSGGPAGGLPFSESASIDIGTLRNTVSTWCRHIYDERGQLFPGDLAPALRWLAEQLEWLRHQPQAGEAFDELDDAARLVVRAVDRPAQRRYLGPCQEPDGLAGACPGELYAHPQADTARCRECGTGHSVRERKDWLDGLVREHAYTAVEIADAYPHVRADRIRQWASRGQIASHGTDRHGRPLYPLKEVLELAARVDRPGRKTQVAA